MDRRVVAPFALTAVAVVLALGASGAFTPLYTTSGYDPATATPNETATATATPYEHATVTVRENGTNRTLGQVHVAIADTFRKRYTGLSKTESLPEDHGMLFVFDEPRNHTFVMRGMDFGIDIVYVGADGHITSIHHAEEPPEGADGGDYEYPGYGQYVLEVPYNWTGRHGVSEGDNVVISGYED